MNNKQYEIREAIKRHGATEEFESHLEDLRGELDKIIADDKPVEPFLSAMLYILESEI